jgi:large subunit ribosomal protein L2
MESQNRFQYFHFLGKQRQPRLPISRLFAFLGAIAKLSLVSLIELTPKKGAQYVRSSGVNSRLFAFDYARRTAVLQLPSKLKKTFSLYSVSGVSPLMGERLHINTRAGYRRKMGFKSIVRGVATNPVDHPHGGRAKSIKYPRTP